jgi:hypothetical protein
MAKDKFLIMVNHNGEKTVGEVFGYIRQKDDLWFGIHREDTKRQRRRWLWVVTELSTGLKVSREEYNTIKEAEDSITEEIVTMCKDYFNGKFKELFAKDKQMVKKAYEDRGEEYAKLYWKIYPEEWQG